MQSGQLTPLLTRESDHVFTYYSVTVRITHTRSLATLPESHAVFLLLLHPG